MVYDIRNYGAIGDGKTVNTKFIQDAIDACANAGGGRVLVSGGKFMTGTINLKSNVDFHIASDGVLYGSPKCDDYPEKEKLNHLKKEFMPRWQSSCMIFAEECENISITGNGKIDCNGDVFMMPRTGMDGWQFQRQPLPTPPRVVMFAGCKNVLVKDVTMTNQPAGWSYWIHDCDFVNFDRIKIVADLRYPNNDGIHVNCSRNVTISNCCISCGDDCIVVRANNSTLKENKITEKISVTNCNLTSWSGGIRVGWIKDGVIRDCVFSNLVMTDTSCGISILLPGRGEQRISDEGRESTLIENLSFSNIIMDGIYSHPVLIWIEDNPATHCKAIRNLYFTDIHSTALRFPIFHGRVDCPIENIWFNNCSFVRVGEDVLPGLYEHGAAMGGNGHYGDMFTYVNDIRMNNTVITSKL